MEIRNKINMRQRITMINSWTLLLITLGVECLLTNAQFQINRPPAFTPGGDMARFSISENTPVGSPVYQLQGIDKFTNQLAKFHNSQLTQIIH